MAPAIRGTGGPVDDIMRMLTVFFRAAGMTVVIVPRAALVESADWRGLTLAEVSFPDEVCP